MDWQLIEWRHQLVHHDFNQLCNHPNRHWRCCDHHPKVPLLMIAIVNGSYWPDHEPSPLTIINQCEWLMVSPFTINHWVSESLTISHSLSTINHHHSWWYSAIPSPCRDATSTGPCSLKQAAWYRIIWRRQCGAATLGWLSDGMGRLNHG